MDVKLVIKDLKVRPTISKSGSIWGNVAILYSLSSCGFREGGGIKSKLMSKRLELIRYFGRSIMSVISKINYQR